LSGSHLAACLAEVGEFTEATRQAEEALHLAESTNHPDTQLWAYRGVAFVRLSRGDGAAAEAALERALALCQTGDLPTYIPRVSAELGLAQALAGRSATALPLIEQALATAVTRKQTGNLPHIVLDLGEAQLLAGKLGEAAASAERALDLFRRQGGRGNEAHALRLLADISWRRDPPDYRAATEWYREAAALAGELGMRPLAARCELGVGLLWRSRGDEARALPHLAEATARLREMEMTRWLQEAQTTLAGSGQAGPPADPDGYRATP
jgi:tetratricopeptide (TPR) repeat protein